MVHDDTQPVTCPNDCGVPLVTRFLRIAERGMTDTAGTAAPILECPKCGWQTGAA